MITWLLEIDAQQLVFSNEKKANENRRKKSEG
jgi:hypothetical protein